MSFTNDVDDCLKFLTLYCSIKLLTVSKSPARRTPPPSLSSPVNCSSAPYNQSKSALMASASCPENNRASSSILCL